MAKTSRSNKPPKPQQLTPVAGKLPYKPKTAGQVEYLRAMREADVTFCLGVAGSGKSVLATQQGYQRLIKQEVERLVISRPIVGVGRTSGYLPGTIDQKLTPFLDHLYDELIRMSGDAKMLGQMKEQRQLVIVPFEYMRGRTFHDAFVIVDEAQNCTYDELFLLLTRMGEGSRMVIIGDITQSDLPLHEQGALASFARELGTDEGFATVELTNEDIVRHPIVRRVIERMQPIVNAHKNPTHPRGVGGRMNGSPPPQNGVILNGNGNGQGNYPLPYGR